MMGYTTDRNDPRLGHGVDTEPTPQHEVYLVADDEKRKTALRPIRTSYRHVGSPGPTHPLRDLTAEEHERFDRFGYIKFEDYGTAEADGAVVGCYWTQARLDNIGKGCGAVTNMGLALAQTYAADPKFYGATYCARCGMHLKVGADGEFVWVEEDGSDGPRVGT